MMDGHHQDMEGDLHEAYGKHQAPKRDWVTMISSALLVGAVTLGLQVFGYIWFMAKMSSRVDNIDLRVEVTEAQLKAMPKDYVPREEHLREDALARENRDRVQVQMDKIDSKVDQIYIMLQARPTR